VPAAEEELREQLRALARAADLPVPELEVEPDPKAEKLPTRVRRGDDGVRRIHASSSLLAASMEERTWHLASSLAWWASPVPRRRRRQTWGLLTAVAVPYAGLTLASLFDNIDVPRAVLLVGTLLGLVFGVFCAGLIRREQRSFDAAGHDVLAASGYSPATLARQVFGDQQDPPWHKQVFSAEPRPSRRIADAEEWQSRPHRALH
jgi:hypothetical protein